MESWVELEVSDGWEVRGLVTAGFLVIYAKTFKLHVLSITYLLMSSVEIWYINMKLTGIGDSVEKLQAWKYLFYTLYGIDIDIQKELALSFIVYLDKANLADHVIKTKLNAQEINTLATEFDLLVVIAHSLMEQESFKIC